MRGLRTLRHRIVSTTGVVAILLVAFMSILLLDRALSGWRIDLTDRGVYTLADGTRDLLADLDAPITLQLYFSADAARDLPRFTDYARFIGDTLATMEAAAEGRLHVERINLLALTPEEDAARLAGLVPLAVDRRGEELILGVVAVAETGSHGALSLLAPDEDALLEYRLARLIDEVTRPRRPRVAMVSGLPLDRGFDASGRPTPAAEVVRRMEARFELLRPDLASGDALTDIDALVLVHPRDLTDAARYAIDQYLLGGGPALVFVDPFAERDPQATALDFAMPSASRASNPRELLAAWGLRMDSDVVLDAEHAMPVALAPGRAPIRHLAMAALTPEAFTSNDVVMARLEQINLSTAGALHATPGATTRFEPLMHSADASMLLAPERHALLTDPAALASAFVADAGRQVTAARITGPARSAFEGLPGFAPERVAGDIELIVVADTDLLADPMWVTLEGYGDRRRALPWASNGDLVINVLDQFGGSDALLGIRGQPRLARPFHRIDAMRREADARLLTHLLDLEAELAMVEQRLEDYRSSDDDNDFTQGQDALRTALGDHLAERMRLREEVRSIRRRLDADIDRLTERIELANVFGVPALVALTGMLFGWRRRQRLRKSR